MTPKRLKMLDYVVLTIDSFISNSSLITEGIIYSHNLGKSTTKLLIIFF